MAENGQKWYQIKDCMFDMLIILYSLSYQRCLFLAVGISLDGIHN